jgi:(S)-2-hydroxyglutarate dehydrogenase
MGGHMYDFAIVGGGIIGLSTALALGRRYAEARLLLLEKEEHWAAHQTGHNSGVIHSGIYYKPDSLKAKLAREGNRAMVEFCREHALPHEVCGKVIVATEPEELPLLEALCCRGKENGLELSRLTLEELAEIEPHVRGLAAVRVPSTGIVDYRRVSETLASLLQQHGADLRLNTELQRVVKVPGGVQLVCRGGDFRARVLINCAGLHSDRVARLAGRRSDVQIVPFRGEYYRLKPERRSLVRHLIYPVPNPNFPFLGVHFTRMVNGDVEAGPNAVLSLKREGYRRTDFHPRDFAAIVGYPGMWRLAMKYWREGSEEIVRSFSKAAFVRSLQRLIPEVQAEDLEPAPAGVRAQALRRSGELVDDFYILADENQVHVCNAPSPAATASLSIGQAIVGRVTTPERTAVGV